MAIGQSTVFRYRAGGSDTNGGAFDPTISGALSTTLNGGITTSQTTITVASVTGWPTSGNYYARIGATGGEPQAGGNGAAGFSEVVLVTGGQGTTTWTVTRAQLGTSGVAQLTGVVVDNDISRCDTAMATGTTGTSTASTTFTDVSGAFNKAMVGNGLWIASGTGATHALFMITAVASATSLTLDRASGTYTLGVYAIGGGWQNFQSGGSTTTANGTIGYIRGAGTTNPSPASPQFTHASTTVAGGSTASGYLQLIGENGVPSMKGSTNTIFNSSGGLIVTGVYFLGAATGSTAMLTHGGATNYKNCIFDQNGFDQTIMTTTSSIVLDNCEFLNSGSAPAAANAAITTGSGSYVVKSVNIHDVTSNAISITGAGYLNLHDSIVSNCGSDNILISAAPPNVVNIVGNTIDAGAGNGILFSSSTAMGNCNITNNIFSNFTGISKAAIANSAVTQAVADLIKMLIDYNAFYNNTANYTAISAGAHDIALGSSPYVAQSTENYTLSTGGNAALAGTGYLGVAYPQSLAGKTATVRSLVTPGAIQPTTAQAGSLKTNPSLSGVAQ